MKLNKTLKKKFDKSHKYIAVIDKIEKIRVKNNANWMDILRLAVSHAPKEAIKLMKRINKKDQSISRLFNKVK